MSKYRKRFLDLAFETGIINRRSGDQRLQLDPFFQGNAHAVNLAARACREAMNSPCHLKVCNARTLVSFDHIGYPLLPVTAQSFHGGDAKGFVCWETYQHYERHKNGVPTEDDFVILSLAGDEGELLSAVRFTNKHLGRCVGVVKLYSSTHDQISDDQFSIPIIRVVTEEEAEAYLEAHLDQEGRFVPRVRERLLE